MGLLSRFSRVHTYSWHYEQVLGTSLELHITASGEATALAARQAVLDTVDQLNGRLSLWLPSSEVSRWCSTFQVDVPVSEPLLDVLDMAEHWRARTNGAFHPGAQAVVAFLRDDAASDVTENARHGEAWRDMPRARVLDTQRAFVRETQRDAQRAPLLQALHAPLWSTNRAQRTARRLSRLPISLDAIAKGYIVDCAALAAHAVPGVRDVLVNIGGDVRHCGTRAVRVAIADPFSPEENARPIATVQLRHQTLATSGGYYRQFRSEGRAVSHVVDPRTLRAVEQVVSSSVVAPTCAAADALSTACSVLSPAESVALVNATDGAACLLVEANGAHTTSSRWASLVL